MNLSTKYLGIELKNPIIIGASNLVTDIEMLKKLEQAGAAAIVYKSLFEEQIHLENLEMEQLVGGINERHAEMATDITPDFDAGPEAFLLKFAEAKKALTIPLIASLNAIYDDTWIEYAQKLEAAGADALELNFYNNPKDFEMDGKSIINAELDIIDIVKKNVSIPISVKLSPFYTNPLFAFNEMDKKNVDGFVFFNRLFHPDINVNTEKMSFPYNISSEFDIRLPLRYVGLLYDNINADICANRGIFNGEDVIKMILAGANVVEVVSTVYKNGPEHISTMLEEMKIWMSSKNYNSLEDFRGNLSKKNVKDPFAYRRAQYVDILMKSDEIFKDFPI